MCLLTIATIVAMAGPYLSTSEAAAALSVHVRTLQKWAREGQVKAAFRTPGGDYKWDLADLRAQLGMAPEDPA